MNICFLQKSFQVKRIFPLQHNHHHRPPVEHSVGLRQNPGVEGGSHRRTGHAQVGCPQVPSLISIISGICWKLREASLRGCAKMLGLDSAKDWSTKISGWPFCNQREVQWFQVHYSVWKKPSLVPANNPSQSWNFQQFYNLLMQQKHKTASRIQSEEVVFFHFKRLFTKNLSYWLSVTIAFSYQAKDMLSVKEMISCKLFHFVATIHTAA